jgi:hypothetical protein
MSGPRQSRRERRIEKYRRKEQMDTYGRNRMREFAEETESPLRRKLYLLLARIMEDARRTDVEKITKVERREFR